MQPASCRISAEGLSADRRPAQSRAKSCCLGGLRVFRDYLQRLGLSATITTAQAPPGAVRRPGPHGSAPRSQSSSTAIIGLGGNPEREASVRWSPRRFYVATGLPSCTRSTAADSVRRSFGLGGNRERATTRPGSCGGVDWAQSSARAAHTGPWQRVCAAVPAGRDAASRLHGLGRAAAQARVWPAVTSTPSTARRHRTAPQSL